MVRRTITFSDRVDQALREYMAEKARVTLKLQSYSGTVNALLEAVLLDPPQAKERQEKVV